MRQLYFIYFSPSKNFIDIQYSPFHILKLKLALKASLFEYLTHIEVLKNVV